MWTRALNFSACLNHLTIQHVPRSRRSTVPILRTETPPTFGPSSRFLNIILPFLIRKTFCFPYPSTLAPFARWEGRWEAGGIPMNKYSVHVYTALSRNARKGRLGRESLIGCTSRLHSFWLAGEAANKPTLLTIIPGPVVPRNRLAIDYQYLVIRLPLLFFRFS